MGVLFKRLLTPTHKVTPPSLLPHPRTPSTHHVTLGNLGPPSTPPPTPAQPPLPHPVYSSDSHPYPTHSSTLTYISDMFGYGALPPPTQLPPPAPHYWPPLHYYHHYYPGTLTLSLLRETTSNTFSSILTLT